MNIPIILNGDRIMIQASADEKLLNVLRQQKCLSVKEGCTKGTCGSCTVLLNKKPVPACKIPIALVINKEIETLEYFYKSETYSDIIKGFSKAGIKLCGFCNAGKIFATAYIIGLNEKPTRDSIRENIKHLSPCCTDIDTLINGIIYSFDFYSRRTGT